jgi:hypothetical protein
LKAYNTPTRSANKFYESPSKSIYKSGGKSGIKSPMKGREEEHLVRALK